MNTRNNKNEGSELNKKHNFIVEFFWICAGVDRDTLRQCKSVDYPKYVGMGGTIFFTAVFAWLSGGYAVYMIFGERILPAVLIGFLWALMIFNLDRYMVSTMNTRSSVTKIISGLPRIILAVFIGIVISTPLELKIFEDSIEDGLVKYGIENDSIIRSNIEALYAKEFNALNLNIEKSEVEIGKLESEKRNLNDEIDKAYERVQEERDGVSGNGLTGRRGDGPRYKEYHSKYIETKDKKGKEIAAIDSLLKVHRARIDIYNRDIDSIRSVIATKIDERTQNVLASHKFADRLRMLYKVTGPDTGLLTARILIMLLFVLIEIIPTVFKMLMPTTGYDTEVNKKLEEHKLLANSQVDEVRSQISTLVEMNVQKNHQKLEAELLMNKEVLNKIALAQAEIINVAVEEWKKSEEEKIKTDPSKYIKLNFGLNE